MAIKKYQQYEDVGSTTGKVLEKIKTSGLYGGTDTILESQTPQKTRQTPKARNTLFCHVINIPKNIILYLLTKVSLSSRVSIAGDSKRMFPRLFHDEVQARVSLRRAIEGLQCQS